MTISRIQDELDMLSRPFSVFIDLIFKFYFIDMSRLNFLCKHVYENSKAEIMVYKLNKEEKTKLDSRVGFIFKEFDSLTFFKEEDKLALSNCK